MTSTRTGLAVAFAIVTLVVPFRGQATTLRYQSVEQLADAADLVVWGHTTRVGTRMERLAGGGVRPAREALIEVREVLHGDATAAVSVRLLGGAHRQGERRVHGEAELREGEEVVLFLRRAGDQLRVLGMGMGVLRVERPLGGIARLVRRLDDVALVDSDGRELPPVAESLSFDALRAALLGAQQSPRRTAP